MTDSQKIHRVPLALLKRARELRRTMTPQERKLWARLRGKQLYGLKFRRQHPIQRYILDFYCHQKRLAIELDGHGHADSDQEEYDLARTEWLSQQGLRVIRFSNREVDRNIEGVLEEIARVCGIEKDPPSNSPHWGEEKASSSWGEKYLVLKRSV